MGGARRTSWRRRPPSATAIRCRPSRSCRRSCSRRPSRARCRWWPLPAGSAMHRGWGRQILPAPPALRAARWRRAGGAAGAGLIGSRTCYLLSTSCSAAWRSSGCAGRCRRHRRRRPKRPRPRPCPRVGQASCREQASGWPLVGPAAGATGILLAQTAARRVSVGPRAPDRRSGLGGRVSGGWRTSEELAQPSATGDGDQAPTVTFM